MWYMLCAELGPLLENMFHGIFFEKNLDAISLRLDTCLALCLVKTWLYSVWNTPRYYTHILGGSYSYACFLKLFSMKCVLFLYYFFATTTKLLFYLFPWPMLRQVHWVSLFSLYKVCFDMQCSIFLTCITF